MVLVVDIIPTLDTFSCCQYWRSFGFFIYCFCWINIWVVKNRNLEHKDDWMTPKDLYDKLNDEFDFTFDPYPYKHNLMDWDGLKIDWGGRNFVNPPYSLMSLRVGQCMTV